jgi:hypothetical protein
MAYQVDTELADRVLDWIRDHAKHHATTVEVHRGGVVRDGDWFHVPTSVRHPGDAYDRAQLLQAIEDEWDPAAFEGVRLLLVPAKASEPSNASAL